MNLAKNAGSKVKAANEVGKDHIARVIFLNLVVDDEKVVSYQMTKAFSQLEKAQNVLNGREERWSLKLFYYILEWPEKAELILEKLRLNKAKKANFTEKVIF